MINFNLGSDRNLASWLGDTRIDLGCTALLSTLPILIHPALWILTQTSLVLMRPMTLATLPLGGHFFIITCMLGIWFGSGRRRARIVSGLSG